MFGRPSRTRPSKDTLWQQNLDRWPCSFPYPYYRRALESNTTLPPFSSDWQCPLIAMAPRTLISNEPALLHFFIHFFCFHSWSRSPGAESLPNTFELHFVRIDARRSYAISGGVVCPLRKRNESLIHFKQTLKKNTGGCIHLVSKGLPLSAASLKSHFVVLLQKGPNRKFRLRTSDRVLCRIDIWCGLSFLQDLKM